jgi:hypothetical protein
LHKGKSVQEADKRHRGRLADIKAISEGIGGKVFTFPSAMSQ